MSDEIRELNRAKMAPSEGLLPAIAHRWSPRAFSGKALSKADLKTILEAGRWAASSSNEQPWRFIVGLHGSETFGKIYSTLVGFNQAWAGQAGALILSFAMAQTEHSGRVNAFALYDLGAAMAQMAVQASAMGLMAHSMGGYDREAAKAVFGFTEAHHTGAVMAVGYQAEPLTLDNEQLREREMAPRERKPLEQIVLVSLDTPFDFAG